MYDFGRDFAARVAAKHLSSSLGRYVAYGVTVKENLPRSFSKWAMKSYAIKLKQEKSRSGRQPNG